jgi:hypothetical protein
MTRPANGSLDCRRHPPCLSATATVASASARVRTSARDAMSSDRVFDHWNPAGPPCEEYESCAGNGVTPEASRD